MGNGMWQLSFLLLEWEGKKQEVGYEEEEGRRNKSKVLDYLEEKEVEEEIHRYSIENSYDLWCMDR